MRSYTSKLAPYITGLVREKQSEGFIFGDQAYELQAFDHFVIGNGYDSGTITRELVMDFASQKPTENRNTRNHRVSCVKQLAKYMISLGLDAYIPKGFASGERTIPYLPSIEELTVLFGVIDAYVPPQEKLYRFSLVYPVVFRLFYCCGLRLSEGCYLKASAVDLEQGTLTILHSKGDKDRLVYLADDVLDLCRRYDKAMETIIPDREWFFPGWNPARPFNKTSLDLKFRQFWCKTPYATLHKEPTIHSLRHCFVVRRMNEWITQGLNIDVMMPYLSRYLGHSSIQESYYYYHSLDSRSPALRMHIEANGEAVPEVVPYEEY
jgi:integrase